MIMTDCVSSTVCVRVRVRVRVCVCVRVCLTYSDFRCKRFIAGHCTVTVDKPSPNVSVSCRKGKKTGHGCHTLDISCQCLDVYYTHTMSTSADIWEKKEFNLSKQAFS